MSAVNFVQYRDVSSDSDGDYKHVIHVNIDYTNNSDAQHHATSAATLAAQKQLHRNRDDNCNVKVNVKILNTLQLQLL